MGDYYDEATKTGKIIRYDWETDEPLGVISASGDFHPYYHAEIPKPQQLGSKRYNFKGIDDDTNQNVVHDDADVELYEPKSLGEDFGDYLRTLLEVE